VVNPTQRSNEENETTMQHNDFMTYRRFQKFSDEDSRSPQSPNSVYLCPESGDEFLGEVDASFGTKPESKTFIHRVTFMERPVGDMALVDTGASICAMQPSFVQMLSTSVLGWEEVVPHASVCPLVQRRLHRCEQVCFGEVSVTGS
jgi:hypothetical protein